MVLWSGIKCGSNRNPSQSKAIQGANHKGIFTAGYIKEKFRKGSGKISVFSHLRQHWLMSVIEEKLLRPLHKSL